jgi:hypothetical protein
MAKTQRVKFPVSNLVMPTVDPPWRIIGICFFLAGYIIFPHFLRTVSPQDEPVKLISQSPVNQSPPVANRNTVSGQIEKKYQQVNGVIHLQTPVSGGTRRIGDYIKLAREHNISIVIITDHDSLNYEYSIYPLRWLVKKTVVKESVFNYGVNEYLELINNRRTSNPDILLVDGVESIPFYYWSGSYQTNLKDKLGRRELILNDRGKHILAIGLNSPDAYEHLPVIGNGYSRYDAYHGGQADKPYQDLIDYVNAKGGVTFWAHPEAGEKWMREGITVNTSPYYESILNTIDYTGFAVLPEGYQKVGRIGGLWDEVLKAYCAGKRKSPVWAIGELDDYGNKPIDIVQTIFLLNDKSYNEIINALKSGKMYAVSKAKGDQTPLLSLERFTVHDKSNPKEMAYSGDEIACKGNPFIKIRLSHKPVSIPARPPMDIGGRSGGSAKITLKLIREGKLIKEYNESLPCEITFEDNHFSLGTKTYYRVDVTDEFNGKIVSNPIFVSPSRDPVRDKSNK